VFAGRASAHGCIASTATNASVEAVVAPGRRLVTPDVSIRMIGGPGER
jgi:hypothetical protein